MKTPLLIGALLLLSAGIFHAQQFDRPPALANHPRQGLLAHNVLSASSNDGLSWTRDEGVRIAGASVPCAINDGDKRILIYFVQPSSQPGRPETIACAVSEDGTNFKQDTAFHIEGLSTLKAVDPSIVRDPEGKFRLYYLASDYRGDPARGANPHHIHLALSDDGIRFRETGSVFEYDNLVDPDVFRFRDQWFMYVFAGRATIIATSADGKRFSYSRDMSPPDWGTTAPVLLPDGRLRLYAFEQRVPTANAIRSFLSAEGVNWTAEEGNRLVANAGEQITDPFVVPWRGGYKMYFKRAPAHGRGNDATAETSQNTAAPDGPPRNPPGVGLGQTPLAPPEDHAMRPPPHITNAHGPWNQDVIAYRITANGVVEKVATFERAGVPTIARLKDDHLIVAHQHFPENDPESFDKVAVHFSSDGGKTWTAPQVIRVDGLPEGMRFPFDPTLLPLPDGSIRLYFTGNMRGKSGTPAIHSAISTDGVHYAYEPGTRFAVEGRAVIDCAAVLHDGVFHLYSPDNGVGPDPGRHDPNEPASARPRDGVGYHAVSKDGLNFTRAADVQIQRPEHRKWLGGAGSEGKLITFYGTGPGLVPAGSAPSPGGLWMATSRNGQDFQLVPNPAVEGADPGAVRMPDGSLVVVATSRPVRGPMADRTMPPQNPDGGPDGPAK